MDWIEPERAQIVAELQAVGVAATLDPAVVLQLAAAHGVAAIVGPATDVRVGFGAPSATFTVAVRLVAPTPEVSAYPALTAVLPDVLYALQARVPAVAGPVTVGETDLPGYTIDTARKVAGEVPVIATTTH